MPWNIQWCEPRQPYSLGSATAGTESEVVRIVKQALHNGATNIDVAAVPPAALGPTPLANIAAAFKDQRVIPFLGAGVPLSGRPPGLTWAKGCDFLPSAAELSQFIARKSHMPVHYIRDSANLARVASYFGATNDLQNLSDDLELIFSKGKPAPIHRFLAENVPHPMLIVTTNYDVLMERALDAAGIKYDRVIHFEQEDTKASVYVWPSDGVADFVEPDQLRRRIDPKQKTVLYKMHGSVDIPRPGPDPYRRVKDNRFVITEEHYADFLSRINATPPIVPAFFSKAFRERSFLFLGYSLEDWNLRVILHSLNGVLPQESLAPSLRSSGLVNPQVPSLVAPPVATAPSLFEPYIQQHWSIQFNPTPYDMAVWRSRNVTIGNHNLTTFVDLISDPVFDLGKPALNDESSQPA